MGPGGRDYPVPPSWDETLPADEVAFEPRKPRGYAPKSGGDPWCHDGIIGVASLNHSWQDEGNPQPHSHK